MGFFDRLFKRIFRKEDERPTEEEPLEDLLVPANEETPTGDTSSTGSPLDAGQFLPITNKEMKAEAKDIRGFDPWAGRRSVIPPASDPRTSLIDRAMITHGFLTPEQLLEMHRVGEAWDQYQTVFEAIHRRAQASGEAAVRADRQAREQIKAQKKAESAARKRKRADQIAHRRQNDIVFLGRDVSHRLHLRDSDIELLNSQELPVFSTPADVAQAIGLTVPKLRWLAFHTDVAERIHYVQFSVPKKSGGERILSAPHKTLAQAQSWILTHVLSRLGTEDCAHGFVPGRSILTNATPHAGKSVVVNVDLENFFPSITFPRVGRVFEKLGYSPAVATLFALLCTECPRREVRFENKPYHVALGPRGLPQGACTSPALSNQVAQRLDRRLMGLAKKMGITYTRYADDLTFSAEADFNEKVGYLLARIRHIAQEEGFTINPKKTRVLRQNTAQIVTGLVVNEKPSVRRADIRRLRAILHRAKHEGLENQNREGHPNFVGWLRGMIAYVSMTRPEVGAKMKAELEALVS